MSLRIPIPEYALGLAVAASVRSEEPEIKVGCVIVSEDNRIIATGYNGLAPGITTKPSFWTPENRERRDSLMIHAEVNACALIKRGEAWGMAVTHAPCLPCAKVIAAAGIKWVCHLHDSVPKHQAALDFFRFSNIQCFQIK